MSINNTRAISHISTNSSIIRLTDGDVKHRVSAVEEKKQTSSKSKGELYSVPEKDNQSKKNFYSSAAEEIFTKVSDGYRELAALTSKRINPLAFANINSAPSSRFNNIDLKRHQNYFNHMMEFNNPSGSWVDTNA